MSSNALRRAEALPHNLPPAGLSRDQAAAYTGFGATHFDRLVREGRMPRPKRAGARLIWLRAHLDAALAALPDDGNGADSSAVEDDVWANPEALN